jgi:hypothetical protein
LLFREELLELVQLGLGVIGIGGSVDGGPLRWRRQEEVGEVAGDEAAVLTRTVDYRLRNMFTTLGITSRSEFAAVLASEV